tara:strand:+ start:225 stop:605 length:381 start_codon:yes stop_codon:yes gene_type:complete
MPRLTQNTCHFSSLTLFIIVLFTFSSCSSVTNSSDEKAFENMIDSTMLSGENRNGLKNGEWISYFPNGEIQSICHFSYGIPDGAIIVYNNIGQELYRGNFDNGKKIGEWVFTNHKNNQRIVKQYGN